MTHLCKEDDDYTFLASVVLQSADATSTLEFGAPFLEPKDLRQVHWITLLRFAKTSKRF